MANLIDIAKAKIQQKALGRVFGVEPLLDIQEDHVRLYWSEASIPIAQAKVQETMSKDPGTVRIDIFPVLKPWVMKEATPWLIGSGIAGFAIKSVL